MKITRVWAMPNKETFLIKPIAELLQRYVGDGKDWIDPFAGKNSPAEYTNDLNPKMPTVYHRDAYDFCKCWWIDFSLFNGILFDPPYSNRQIKECYEKVGIKVTQEDTQSCFYSKVKDKITHKIKKGGYAISFGWNSNGFGKKRGFELIEILLVAHGNHHNDTIVTVERRGRVKGVGINLPKPNNIVL